ncbi:MAG: nitronate monooxygenase [Candidatus Hydrogenedentes bacterium]|nr:nitronate monooxygenase [Candidatus Hydrogenedentota bacterium]
MEHKLPDLVIGDLTINPPIIQGGMGVRVSGASLAGAVSAEGALGVIASVGLPSAAEAIEDFVGGCQEALRREIRAVKAKGLPVGVNIMVALSNYDSLVEACVEEGADAIISGAGLPLKLPGYVGDAPIKLVPIVSSGKAAALICNYWSRKYDRRPDAIVLEGPRAGGHLGFRFDDVQTGNVPDLETLLADLLEVVEGVEQQHAVKIPVVVAGGVSTGADIARFLRLGADGVQMATRFVATHECDVSQAFKEVYVNARDEDVIVIHSPVGLPGRVIRNRFVERILEGEKFNFRCPYHCLITCKPDKVNYCIAEALVNAADGNFERGFAMCGANVGRIDRIVSVKELLDELTRDAVVEMQEGVQGSIA